MTDKMNLTYDCGTSLWNAKFERFREWRWRGKMGENRECRVFASFLLHLHCGPGGEVTAQSLRFEKDRELEDAIIRKRKSQLVPPLRDTETTAYVFSLRRMLVKLRTSESRCSLTEKWVKFSY